MLTEVHPSTIGPEADSMGPGVSPSQSPCDLFRRVQKRSGAIVDFDPSKIADSIFRAARSVAGKDRARAATLAEYVILDLVDRHKGKTNLLKVEQILDSIERVLVEKGHYRTGRAFITYRDERSRRRSLQGSPDYPAFFEEDENGSLRDVAVWTSTGDSIRWDRERIVKALVRETNLPYDEARKVSHAVEMEIIHSKISRLTAPLIRELTNAQLLQLDHEEERRLHSRLGLPIYDVEERLIGTGQGRGRTIEAEILRQFATEKVVPLAVTEKHGQKDLHVHNLELIHRPLDVTMDLDFPDRESARPFLPLRFETSEETAWDDFLNAWEREETRLLRVVGKRLIWNDVNSAIAFSSRRSGVSPRRAAEQALGKLRRLAGAGDSHPTVVWRLTDKSNPHWQSKVIGARQESLLPEGDFESASRGVFLEILSRVEEAGPFWVGCGVEFEVEVEAKQGQLLEKDLVEAAARCLAAGAPIRVLFKRDTPVSSPVASESYLQTVTLNFPRAALAAEGDDSKLLEWLEDRLALAIQAHVAKRDLVERMLRSSALAPLASPESDCPGDHPLRLGRAVYGLGVFGLDEMTRIHRGTLASEDEASLKWLLGVLAHLRIRAEEIGGQLGVATRLVATAEDRVVDRLSKPHASHSEGMETLDSESNLGERENGSRASIEGKLHSLLTYGHVAYVEEYSRERTAESLGGAIQELAGSTSVSGFSLVGESRFCGECGHRFWEKTDVCGCCGSRARYEVVRDRQGMQTRISRF